MEFHHCDAKVSKVFLPPTEEGLKCQNCSKPSGYMTTRPKSTGYLCISCDLLKLSEEVNASQVPSKESGTPNTQNRYYELLEEKNFLLKLELKSLKASQRESNQRKNMLAIEVGVLNAKLRDFERENKKLRKTVAAMARVQPTPETFEAEITQKAQPKDSSLNDSLKTESLELPPFKLTPPYSLEAVKNQIQVELEYQAKQLEAYRTSKSTIESPLKMFCFSKVYSEIYYDLLKKRIFMKDVDLDLALKTACTPTYQAIKDIPEILDGIQRSWKLNTTMNPKDEQLKPVDKPEVHPTNEQDSNEVEGLQTLRSFLDLCFETTTEFEATVESFFVDFEALLEGHNNDDFVY